jgi:hypothetical protein
LGSGPDVNGNGIPDECETDCNQNGLPDSYELAEMLVQDCNNNSRPDSCDIADGTAGDCNGNSVPDSCELGVVLPANAVQWRVSDGGNGHWYALLPNTPGWMNCATAAKAAGGHLATLTSAAENQFVLGIATDFCRLAIGLRQVTGAAEPSGGWHWITGEPLVYTNWYIGEPNNVGGIENFGELRKSQNPQWNDVPDSAICGAIVEWDFTPATDCDEDGVPDACGDDCNENGIPDACDIANGDIDKDGDGIPDSCEYARGDFDLDGCVDGTDLSFILATWGMVDIPVADLDGNGVVGSTDLTILLANWGCGDEP